jgi:hypothetical protein
MDQLMGEEDCFQKPFIILNSEMKTTDYTECTDTEDVMTEELVIQKMSGAGLAIH